MQIAKGVKMSVVKIYIGLVRASLHSLFRLHRIDVYTTVSISDHKISGRVIRCKCGKVFYENPMGLSKELKDE